MNKLLDFLTHPSTVTAGSAGSLILTLLYAVRQVVPALAQLPAAPPPAPLPTPPAVATPADPTPPGPAVPPPLVARPPAESDVYGLEARLAEARRASGLGPVDHDDRLATAATTYAASLARRDTIDHRGEDGSWPWDRMVRAGWPAGTPMSECLAMGQRSPAEVVQDWLSDPPHRAIVLGNYDRVGIGVAEDAAGRKVWVADFGRAP